MKKFAGSFLQTRVFFQKRFIMSLPDNLNDFGVLVLNTKETSDKAKLTLQAYDLYKNGKLKVLPDDISKKLTPPDKPERPENIKTVDIKETPGKIIIL